ncbi:TetR/AcrR family transcriptional regulator [Gordonia sp. VNK21]|uniref:TetR/AcrR family transcriptional regulator n=1 Tax=Gordonia sp. VNK21 TaxID=3382483 RepID=UPI0038D43047
MEKPVNTQTSAVSAVQSPRRYDSTRRRAAAAARRTRILDAARECFVSKGYAATTIASIAAVADVAPDTVYTLVGRKAEVFAELIELALSGTDHPVPGAQRDYAVRMRAAPTAREKLTIYADAITGLQGRLAPLFLVLRDAAAADDELRALWESITARRARNMRLLAADLATTGELRDDLTLDEAADVIWTMNSSEYYAMLVLDRGWPVARFRDWLIDSWCRLLLG